jgi:hypothetical protein
MKKTDLQQIIKEEFWDVLSGFFGRENSEEIFKTFKDRMGDWLVLHLSPRKQDGWIPKAIKRAVNDIQLRDVEKITDCKFLTNILLTLSSRFTTSELSLDFLVKMSSTILIIFSFCCSSILSFSESLCFNLPPTCQEGNGLACIRKFHEDLRYRTSYR